MTEPLRWPSDALQPTRAVRWLKYFPIVGWTIGALLTHRAVAPRRRAISAQLAERRRPDAQVWGPNAALATKACEAIRRGMDWPNDHFIPEDPLIVLLEASWDGLQGIDVVFDVQKATKTKLSQADLTDLPNLTLGQFVELLASRRRES